MSCYRSTLLRPRSRATCGAGLRPYQQTRQLLSTASRVLCLCTICISVFGMTATVVADEGLAFGRGFRGNTGQGTETGLLVTATPLNTSNLGNRNVTQVAAGTVNSLVLTENGAVYSFGENLGGKTGLGLVDGVTTVPTPIDTINLGGLKIAQIST